MVISLINFRGLLFFHWDAQLAGRMRNQLYPLRLANYIDKNAQHYREATLAGQDALKSVHEVNKVRESSIFTTIRVVVLTYPSLSCRRAHAAQIHDS